MMSFQSRLLLTVFLLLLIGTSVAAAQDLCRAALTETGLNRLSEVDQSDINAYTYDQSCKQSSTIHGLDTSFKMLKPYGIDGTSAGKYDNREAYCREMATTYSNAQYNFRKVSQVVESSVKNWLSCVQWTTAGINVVPQIRRGVVTLTFTRGLPSPAVIRGVQVVNESAAQCKAQTVRNSRAALEKLGPTFEYKLPTDEGLVITCTRTPRNSTLSEGELTYPAVVVSVGTSDPRLGAFMLELDEEPVATERWASDISRTIVDLRSKNEGLEKSVAKLQADLLEAKKTSLKEVTLGAGSDSGYGGDGAFISCKSGEVVVAVGVGSSQNARVRCAPIVVKKD